MTNIPLSDAREYFLMGLKNAHVITRQGRVLVAGQLERVESYPQQKAKLAVMGSSGGGQLVGTVQAKRPDLFGIVIPRVGVMDLLRFDRYTFGPGWAHEFGSPEARNRPEAMNLYLTSPYHNLQAADYGATLVLAGGADTRVDPAHSYKYLAKLQAKQKGKAPKFLETVKAFQARGTEKSAATRKTPGRAARATVQSPWRRMQPEPRAIDQ